MVINAQSLGKHCIVLGSSQQLFYGWQGAGRFLAPGER